MRIGFTEFLGVVQKGLDVVGTLSKTGQSIEPAVTAIKTLVTRTQTGVATHSDLAATDATLDRLIADFNEPMS